jgi:hypothetical protein
MSVSTFMGARVKQRPYSLLVSASWQKLAESIEDFCFLRGKCTKLGEGGHIIS